MLIEALSILTITNTWRADQGLAEWQSHPELANIAHNRWLEMCTDDYFAHQDDDGHHWLLAVNQSSYDYQIIAENLALGQKSAEKVVEAWLNSPSHRATVAGEYTEVGIYSGVCQIDGRPQNLVVEIAATPRRSKSSQNQVSSPPETATILSNLLLNFFLTRDVS